MQFDAYSLNFESAFCVSAAQTAEAEAATNGSPRQVMWNTANSFQKRSARSAIIFSQTSQIRADETDGRDWKKPAERPDRASERRAQRWATPNRLNDSKNADMTAFNLRDNYVLIRSAVFVSSFPLRPSARLFISRHHQHSRLLIPLSLSPSPASFGLSYLLLRICVSFFVDISLASGSVRPV